MDDLQHWLLTEDGTLGHWTPLVMFGLLMCSGIGIPVSEDVVNIPAGVLAGKGLYSVWVILIAAYLGVIGGDALWFFLMGRFGTRLLQRRWFKRMVHPRRLLQVKYQFETRGPWVLVAARFIPGTRSPVITAAGLLHMPWRSFLLVQCVCVAITVPLQVGLGFLIGRQLGGEDLARSAGLVASVIAGVLLISIAIPMVIQFMQRAKVPPRARAAWLRRYRPGRPAPRLAAANAVGSAGT